MGRAFVAAFGSLAVSAAPWLLVGLIAAAGIAVAGDLPTVFSGRRRCPQRRRISRAMFGLWWSGSIPGAMLFVRQGDRSDTVTAGYADKATRRPMRAGDAFPIGSTTIKTYTAVLVMRLVAQGKVALDAPVSKYLPGLLPDGKRITIRQLLSHTSGLDDYTSDTRFIAPYLQGNFGYAWTPRQMVAFAASQPRAFAPGTKFAYSNTNYIVLGLLAERVAGKSYERQLADSILGPLKLNHTSLPANNRTLPDVHGYVGSGAQVKGADAAPVDSAASYPGVRLERLRHPGHRRGRGGLLARPVPRQAAPRGAGRGDAGHQHKRRRIRARDHADRRPCVRWRPFTAADQHHLRSRLGHGGALPGYTSCRSPAPTAPPSRPACEHRRDAAVAGQYKQIYDVLATAYCRGVTP